MRMKQIGRVAAALAALGLTVAASASGTTEVFRVGDLILRDHGGIRPTRLPRHQVRPITAHVYDRIETADGSHPPAFRHLVADFDRTIVIDAKGLPGCRIGQLQARSSAAARAACGDALVGSGEAEVEVAFPEQEPFSAAGPLLAFNGGIRGGVTTLYVHAYVDVPAPTAVIATIRISRIHQGRFGIHTVTTIPRIAGGAGSPTRFTLELGRRFTYRGHAESYLSARCPTGTYFAKAQALFADGTLLHITHAFPCTPVEQIRSVVKK